MVVVKPSIFLIILAGAGGGVLRGVMGITKSVVTKKDFRMNWGWFFVSLVVSAIIGVIAATFFGDDLRLALLAGYAGADFIEGLMKIKLKSRFLEKGEGKVKNKKAAGKDGSGFGELLKRMD